MKIVAKTLPELQQFAKKLAKKVRGGETLAFIGELGAGKTTFIKAFLRASGIKKQVTSPTFVLMVPYTKAKKTFYHLDLYRIKNFKELQALGLEQLWDKKENIFLIEWGDKIKKFLPKNTTILKFTVNKNGSRTIEVLKLLTKKVEPKIIL